MGDAYIEPCRSPEAVAGVCEKLLGRHCGRVCMVDLFRREPPETPDRARGGDPR